MSESQVLAFPTKAAAQTKFPAHYLNLGFLRKVANSVTRAWGTKHGFSESLPPKLQLRLDQVLMRHSGGFMHATYDHAEEGWFVTFVCRGEDDAEFVYSFPFGGA